ncbi:HEPN domain-containing protein [Segetibacter aerophilus]|uniref:HEPN domain-containing protein n=1 Tax=Segetibacter aerophilus TaxID=670293 RepID=A0A512BBH8_9BACT|nr:HEPN domain-containing protein [Segetibacter aerophilus]GEO09235.1 hypothetical protein SAE01_17310 [Segetibacter aerophilus]
MKKAKPPAIVTEFLFTSAQGFLDNAINLARLAKQHKGLQLIYYLAPATVNISFAIELLLKGVVFKSTGKNAYGHDLSKLFNQIPSGIQELIRESYLSYKLTQTAELGNYKIMASDTDNSCVNKQIETSTVEHLLTTHANSFEKWRYAYELNDYEYFCIGFNALHTFVKAVNDGCKKYAPTWEHNA